MDHNEISLLYHRLGPMIYRRCLKLLRHPENARDATQEVFVRALRHAAELTEDRQCLPWLYRVATNYCLNALRDGRPQGSPVIDEAPGTVPLSEETLTARGTVLALLGEVDEATAQIAVYVYLDGMTQEETAEVTGLSRRTIGKKLKRFDLAALEFKRQGRWP